MLNNMLLNNQWMTKGIKKQIKRYLDTWKQKHNSLKPQGCSKSNSKSISSVQFSRSILSDYLRPHEPQYARPPCPSPPPGVYPNPCPLCPWCHQTILSSVVPLSSSPQSFPASGSFQMSQLSTSGAKVLEFQLQHQSLQWTPRTDLL